MQFQKLLPQKLVKCLGCLLLPWTLFGALAIAFVWIGVVYQLSSEKTKAVALALERGNSLAKLFEDFTIKILKAADQKLLFVRMAYEDNPQNFNLPLLAKRVSILNDDVMEIGIIGPDGYLKARTDYSGPPIDLRDREHFRAQVDANVDKLFISKPTLLRSTGRLQILLSRRMTRPDGTFGGVITASVDPSFAEQFQKSVKFPKASGVILRGFDGIARTYYGFPAPPNQISKAFKDATSKAPQGHLWLDGRRDHIKRLATYRIVKGYPLIASVAQAEEGIFSDYYSHRQNLWIIAGFITIIVLISVSYGLCRKQQLQQSTQLAEKHSRERDLALRSMAQGLFLIDVDGHVSVFNDRVCELLNLPKEFLEQRPLLSEIYQRQVNAGEFDSTDDRLRKTISDAIHYVNASCYERKRPNGTVLEVRTVPLHRGGAVRTFSDITDRVRAQEEFAGIKVFLDSIVQNMPSPVAIKDAESRKFVLVNKAYEEFLGLPRKQILGTTAFECFSAQVAKTITDLDDDVLCNNDIDVASEFVLDTKSLKQRTVRTKRVVIEGDNKVSRYLLTLLEDITDRKASEHQIQQLAHYDSLTNLANRNLFRLRLDESLARFQRLGTKFALFMLDLDRFKSVNDTHGHHAGDDLLKQVASRIRETIREIDIAARLGGDEFALVVSSGAGSLAEGAEKLAARLIEILREPYVVEGHEVMIGCSIGVALAPGDGETSDEILKNADLALYRSKTTGRNCYHLYSGELKSEADARNALEVDLRQAIWREEFELNYQPIIDSETRRIRLVEALVRWRHPTRGLIGADEFVPLAEETGLINRVGEWLIIKACQEAMRMPPDIKVAINLSPVQFARSAVVDAVIMGLVEAQLPAERLEIEITEGVLLQDTEQNKETLQQLKNLGVSIVLDDFGVGYSSLSYLTSFSFDKVKIDRSFVEKLDRPETRAIIASIQQLSRTLGLLTCLEGIETEAQFEQARSFGIDLSQGYLFGRPKPLIDLQFNDQNGARSSVAA